MTNMKQGIEEAVRKAGFESGAEFNQMVCEVDLESRTHTHTGMELFQVWKEEDGSKIGLRRVLDHQRRHHCPPNPRLPRPRSDPLGE